jgi:uncharacterized membrane protein YeiH
MEEFLFILNIIGTVAFSVSGAMTAIKKEMDLLGVTIVGAITAVGGGIMRDIIIGKIPPDAFTDPSYVLIAFISAIAVFGYVYFRASGYEKISGAKFQQIVLLADTVGLAAFSVLGVEVAFDAGDGPRLFLTVFLGTITGVGGGVLRDLLVGDKPYILCKHIYACASIAGALVCALLWDFSGQTAATLIGAATVIIIRLLAIHFEWNLPRIRHHGIS